MEEKRLRITVKYKSANPLFEQWLKEWKEEAKKNDSKLQHTYTKALISLKKCPIRFNSGYECKILQGFGDKLCKMIDNKLKEHNSNLTYVDRNLLDGHKNLTQSLSHKKSSPSSSSEIPYIEEYVTDEAPCKSNNIEDLGKQHVKPKLTKQTSSTTDKEYTTLKSKNENPKKITPQTSSTSEESQDFYILEPGNFDIVLYIDTAETTGKTRKSDPLLDELENLQGSFLYEVKKLNVGDYVWICRDKVTKKELILPYIFERKRLDDLATSIKDGRYKEQKFRLKRSGIENIFYIIEHYKTHSLPITTLQQAIINTAVQDGFKIKMTSNLSHTARLLSTFSSLLTQTFERKTLLRCAKENITPVDLTDDMVSLMSFKEFNQSSLKNKPLKVTDLFIRMLVQIHGMSVAKALVVTEHFPTPFVLKQAYDQCDDEVTGEQLLEDFKCANRKLGRTLSRIIFQLFTFKKYS